MDNAQNVIAFNYRLHDNPYRVNIVYLIKFLVFEVYLFVNAVYGFHPALDNRLGLYVRNAFAYAGLYLVDKIVPLLLMKIKQTLHLAASVRIEVVYGDVLHLLLYGVHTEPVGNGRVYAHGFERCFALLVGRAGSEGAHIVKPVGKLYDNNADIL